MTKDLHDKPFDEATKTKLEIFKLYLREWLPVFVHSNKFVKKINIFDFFAGPGCDKDGCKGTPLIVLDEIAAHESIINKNNISLNLYFNEYKNRKYEQLKAHLDRAPQTFFKVTHENKEFSNAFDGQYKVMELPGTANLVFLDQNGFKHITDDVFRKIINLKYTDILFFISSSIIKRFPDHPAISQYINIEAEELQKTEQFHIHRVLLAYYKTLIPAAKQYYLAPFSLKKNANIYGLIFGSGHVYGLEKFLRTAWKVDPQTGSANFDIDDDKIIPGQIDLFTQSVKMPKKLDIFGQELEKNILNGQLVTNKDVFMFVLNNGVLVSHAKNVIKRMMSEGKLSQSNFPLDHSICKAGAVLQEIEVIHNGAIKH